MLDGFLRGCAIAVTAYFPRPVHGSTTLAGAVLYSSTDVYYEMTAYAIMMLWVMVNVGGAIYDKKATVEVSLIYMYMT